MGLLQVVLMAGHHHAAVPQFQIQKLIKNPRLFQEHILAHHPQVRHAILHIGGDIGGFGHDVMDVPFQVFQNQLSVITLFFMNSVL
jgi:hypothetical protein